MLLAGASALLLSAARLPQQSLQQAEMLAPAMTAFERAWRLKPEETRYALTFAQARIFSNQGQLDDLSRSLLSSIVQR